MQYHRLWEKLCFWDLTWKKNDKSLVFAVNPTLNKIRSQDIYYRALRIGYDIKYGFENLLGDYLQAAGEGTQKFIQTSELVSSLRAYRVIIENGTTEQKIHALAQARKVVEGSWLPRAAEIYWVEQSIDHTYFNNENIAFRIQAGEILSLNPNLFIEFVEEYHTSCTNRLIKAKSVLNLIPDKTSDAAVNLQRKIADIRLQARRTLTALLVDEKDKLSQTQKEKINKVIKSIRRGSLKLLKDEQLNVVNIKDESFSSKGT